MISGKRQTHYRGWHNDFAFCALPFLLFFIFLSACHSASAQSEDTVSDEIILDRLEQVKALQNYTVNSILQDDLGFMWLGTLNGLIRFDGNNIKVYKHDIKNNQSLSSNSIQAIAKDKGGNLWIATVGGGLDFFDIQTERFSHHLHNPSDTTSLSGNSLVSVFVDSRGWVWVGTFSNGLNCFYPETKQFRHLREEKFVPVRAIAEDRNGKIWFSSDGIHQINPEDFSIKTFEPQPNDPLVLRNGSIRSLLPVGEDSVWITAHDEEGLFLFRDHSFKKVNLYPNEKASAYTLLKDKRERLWIGTSKGIAILKDGGFQYISYDPCDPQALRKKIVLSLYEDAAGSVWIGTEVGGISKTLPPRKFSNLFYPDARALKTHNSIRSLHEDNKGNIWIGWVQGGVDIVNPFTKTVRPFATPGVDNITSMYQDTDSSVWIGSWDHGLSHYTSHGTLIRSYSHSNNKNSLPDNRVQAILRDKQNVLWIATENGLSQLDVKADRWTEFSKKSNFPQPLLGNNIQSLAFIETPDGSLWAGTWEGLNRIAPDRKSVRYYTSEKIGNGLSDHVVSLHFDQRSQQLWIGAYEGGLRRLDLATDAMTYYTESDGLANNTIFGIQSDKDGHLWLSTNHGLSRFDLGTRTFRNYDAADGLQGNEFFWGVSLKTKSGKMIFGGINGLNMFDPAAISDNTRVPPITFTDLRVFNKSVATQSDLLKGKSLNFVKALEVSYDQSVLTFEFSALNFIYPEKNNYAYKLEGFDKDWIYTENRSATYTNLDPGQYTFHVKASNNDGKWNEEGKSITLIIRPPYWLTWWFKLIVGAFLFLGLAGFYFVRTSAIRSQKRKLELLVEQRTEEIAKKNKEITAQMARVENLKDEIASQRDNIEQQNNLLATAKADLEQKVEERTLQLSQTNKDLIDQNMQLEQFAFMTAHNLRGPVARLLGLGAIFNPQKLDDPVNLEVIDRIRISVADLDEVISDISQILQVQKATHQNMQMIDVLALMKKVEQGLRHEKEAANITINLNVSSVTSIFGVLPYVQSVFHNVISNAIKYADHTKSPKLDIDATEMNDKVIITFTDNGIGFDAQGQREKIFKPFSRLNFQGEGKGLGLFLVKIQMDAMNGTVEIDSTPEVGTKVVLTFDVPPKA